MLTRRDFLKLSVVSLLAFRLPAPVPAQAQEPEPQADAQAWGFPLTFPAYFLESESEPEQELLRTPTRKYYMNVIRKNG